MESEEAHESLRAQLEKIKDILFTKALHNYLEDFRFHTGNELYDVKKEGREASKAVQSLTTTAASQLNALTSKVDLLVKSHSQNTQDTLERKVEELSGQLLNLAQRSR